MRDRGVGICGVRGEEEKGRGGGGEGGRGAGKRRAGWGEETRRTMETEEEEKGERVGL